MRWVLAQGTTVVFVSHDLQAVESICERAVWLRDGLVEADGPVREVLGGYRRTVEEAAELSAPAFSFTRVVKSEVRGPDGGAPRTQEPLDIRVVVESPEQRLAHVHIGVSEGPATPIFVMQHETLLPAGEVELRCSIPHLPLPRGRFYLWMVIFEHSGDLLPWHPVSHFSVLGPDLAPTARGIVRLAPIELAPAWEVEPTS
jgi:hypothetical protein